MRGEFKIFRRRCFQALSFPLFAVILSLGISLLTENASLGAAEDEPIHSTGVNTHWDRKNNIVKLQGNAVVSLPGETIMADEITLDQGTKMLDAKGNCVYVFGTTVIKGEELHFNLNTKTGYVVGGNLSNGGYLLAGENITKIDQGKFKTKWGEYTTCVDCASSWSLLAEDVDLQADDYVWLWKVTTKIKDTPVLWLPLLVLPTKRNRQTGFIAPKLVAGGQHGFGVIQPFFWATGRSHDMTFGLGVYSYRGPRAEWEGRMIFSKNAAIQANAFYTRDCLVQDADGSNRRADCAQARRNADQQGKVYNPNRWGVDLRQNALLPWSIKQRARFTEVSDGRYPIDFSNDVPGYSEPVVTSELNLQKITPEFSMSLEAKRFRNLLNFENTRSFDSRTVQLFPRLKFNWHDRFLLGLPVAGGLSFGVSRFARGAGPSDTDVDTDFPRDEATGQYLPDRFGCLNPGAGTRAYLSGCDPLREATRFSFTPTLYSTFRPWGIVNVTPSLQYRSFFYNFNEAVPGLVRGYLLFQTQVSFQLSRIYEFSDPNAPKLQHVIRPEFTYSLIPDPFIREPSHPFIQQIKRREGYQFDNYDIVPLTVTPSLTNYFVPLGHSLSYGFSNRFVQKYVASGSAGEGGSEEGNTYHRIFETRTGQTVDFRQLAEKDASKRVPLTRLYNTANFSYRNFLVGAGYNFYPYLSRLPVPGDQKDASPHEVSLGATWIIERSTRQGIYGFDRSFNAQYNFNSGVSGNSLLSLGGAFSINDYLLPTASVVLNLKAKQRFQSGALGLTLQHPSRCWLFSVNLRNSIDQGFNVGFDFALNLTGTGAVSLKSVGSGQIPGLTGS